MSKRDVRTIYTVLIYLEAMDLLAHLEAYVTVAEAGGFSAAADELGVAQPVLSRRIKLLERQLGGELFDRSRRQITTTPFGVQLLPYAKDVLGRVGKLRQVARTALASAVHALGVPPDCDPAALARVLRAGSERGQSIDVHELPAEERASAVADGTLAFALLRVPPETASRVVPLGLAAVAPLPGPPGRALHLESLRPRRGSVGAPRPVILLTPEDGLGFAAERFRKAAARAGLPDSRIRTVASTAAAVAETLAGAAVLLCPEPFARRHDLLWSPLADTALHRGYEFATSGEPSGVDGAVRDWMEPLLADAVGAAGPGTEPAAPTRATDSPDSRARLAARG